MLPFELDRAVGVLILRPQGKLSAEDFAALAQTIDPYLEAEGKLEGVVIEAAMFPGWEDFSALLSHFRFIREHHRQIARIAVVSDSGFLTAAPKFASHFIGAKVQVFAPGEHEAALAWIASGSAGA